MTTILHARDLSLSYPGAALPALDSVSLGIGAGETVAIMGASGSGKTTLLHCLAGIIRPAAGSITFASSGGPLQVETLDDGARARLRREEFGFVFQQGLLLHELTALENVAVARMLNGVPRAHAEAEAVRWLAHLGLAGMENRRLGELNTAFADVTTRRKHLYVDTFSPLLNHEQWRQDLAANGGTPGQAGYGLMAWLVLHRGWFQWLRLDAPE